MEVVVHHERLIVSLKQQRPVFDQQAIALKMPPDESYLVFD